MLVDGSRDQHIKQTVPIIGQCFFQCRQCRLSRFGSRFGKLHLQLFLNAVHHIHPSVLGIFRRIHDTEVGRYLHGLAMIGRHLGRTIDDRCTQFQHGRVGEGFQDDLIAYSVYISMSDSHSNFTIFHIYCLFCSASLFTFSSEMALSTGISETSFSEGSFKV